MSPAEADNVISLAESEQQSAPLIRHFQRRKVYLQLTSGGVKPLPDAIKFVAVSDRN